ncbi:MAG TPA: HNH endonuclease [Caulobacteraceae bacterium]|nr:HNH endonuclease [Caulobacteraceae bacterium]
MAKVDGRRLLAAMVDEHVIPLALGGANDIGNRELRCPACAKAKTSKDLKAILKAKRIERRLLGLLKPKPKIRSRPFARDPLSWRNAEPRS